MKTRSVLATVAVICFFGGPAFAAGDPQIRLTRQQAATTYASVRGLLTNDAVGCPVGQRPVSGLVTGGSSPGSGSRTTTIVFDKGATVEIVRNWSQEGGATSSARITCRPAAS